MTELRKARRSRTFKAASIVLNNGHSTLSCTIKNISEAGAKLVAENFLGMPDEFDLAMSDGSRRRCIVRWRKLNEMGVEFI
ncbi:PilZ domain-containing protein [Rhizobium sp.]|jgi:hypothetical protein|uniref:PilZ domain-containing protein n=1 Tax=Rhizobium sp. TaxID=391 RepID=UPI000E8A1DE1|nr:pilus assembly protein PilZ [Rhizobium sp.]